MAKGQTKRREWELVRNPLWAGQKPQRLERSDCHDGSHFLTVQCRCGEQMHMHESAVKNVSPYEGVASQCKGCARILEFPPSYFAGAFAEMRRLGWIA